MPPPFSSGLRLLDGIQPGEVEAPLRRRHGVYRWFLMRIEARDAISRLDKRVQRRFDVIL